MNACSLTLLATRPLCRGGGEGREYSRASARLPCRFGLKPANTSPPSLGESLFLEHGSDGPARTMKPSAVERAFRRSTLARPNTAQVRPDSVEPAFGSSMPEASQKLARGRARNERTPRVVVGGESDPGEGRRIVACSQSFWHCLRGAVVFLIAYPGCRVAQPRANFFDASGISNLGCEGGEYSRASARLPCRLGLKTANTSPTSLGESLFLEQGSDGPARTTKPSSVERAFQSSTLAWHNTAQVSPDSVHPAFGNLMPEASQKLARGRARNERTPRVIVEGESDPGVGRRGMAGRQSFWHRLRGAVVFLIAYPGCRCAQPRANFFDASGISASLGGAGGDVCAGFSPKRQCRRAEAREYSPLSQPDTWQSRLPLGWLVVVSAS